MKKSKDQIMFEKTMNNLVYPITSVILIKGIFFLLSIPYAMITADIAMKYYDSNIIPFDYMFERIEKTVLMVAISIASVFFIRGLCFLKQYIAYRIQKKEA